MINHLTLLEKLKAYGKRDKQLDLFRNFLKERVQRVDIEVVWKTFLSYDELLDNGVI